MKIKRENKFLIFLLAVILLIVYFSIDFQSLSNRIKSLPDKILSNHRIINFRDKVTYKTLKIKDCAVEYPQSKTNFKHRNYWTGQHGGTNEFHLKYASLHICQCICEKQLLDDEEARKFVLNVLSKDTALLIQYYKKYLQKEIFQDIDSVLKYGEYIFRNDIEKLELLKKYEKSKNIKIENLILAPFKREDTFVFVPHGSYSIDPEFISFENLLNLIEAIDFQGLYNIYQELFFDFELI